MLIFRALSYICQSENLVSEDQPNEIPIDFLASFPELRLRSIKYMRNQALEHLD
jgi:hypothetical protein